MKRIVPSVRPSSQAASRPLRLAVASLALGVLSAHAATYNFTNAGTDSQYTNGLNWLSNATPPGTGVPNTSAGDIAVINNGSAVTYTPGGDLVIKNGGMLQITNGSFTQVGGNNYLQLNGSGSILVNGGTFNQGTASSTPFNLNATTGNAFTLTAGAANFNTSFGINTGLAFSQTGGTLTVNGNETDFNGGSSTLSGGTFVTKLITGVNGPTGNFFSISGGTLNLTGAGSNGIYGGGAAHYLNFTTGSTGQILFSSGQTSVATVQGFVTGGAIELNNAVATLSNFNITSTNGVVSISLVGTGVPEPSTFAAAALGVAGLAGWTLRRRARQAL